MTTILKHRRGTTAQHASFTGAVGEITVDTDKDTAVVHDGTTVGGFPLLAKTMNDGTANGVAYLNGSKVLTTGSALTFDGTNFASSGIITSTNANGLRAQYPSSASYYAQLDSRDGNTYLSAVGSTAAIVFRATDGPGTTEEGMRLTSTGLGIGTSSPQWKLDVQTAQSRFQVRDGANTGGTSAGTGLVSVNATATALDSFNYRATVHAFIVDASEAMRLTSTGLGIGTSSPSYKLDARASAGVGIQFLETSSGSTNRIQLGAGGGLGYINADAGAGAIALALQVGGTTKATLDGSGNLGLGVTPSAWAAFSAFQASRGSFAGNTSELDISHNAYFDGAWKYIANGYATNHYQADGAYIWRTAPSGTAGNAISFTQAMSLTSAGTLLVGRTSPSDTTVGFEVTSGGRVNCGMASGDAYILFSTSAGAYRFYVTNAGVINATSTTITAISDQRLKENIRDLDDGLDVVMALKPRKFDWKAGKGQDIKNARGFIAQEFEQVLPDMIEEWKDPAPEGEEPYKAINANLIPTLVKAIQELKAEFDAYKAAHP